MQKRRRVGFFSRSNGAVGVAAATGILALMLASTAQAGGWGRSSAAQASPSSLTLQELERLALANNPTVAQAQAAVEAARGRRLQAGLFPNPILGYIGEELSLRAPRRTSEHMLFVEQMIPTAGKLGKSRRIFEQEAIQSEAEAEAQRLRVLNAVRLLYYETLGAQQRVELRTELARIAREAVGITGELFNVGQADRPDLLEAEVEAEQSELEMIAAQNEREEVWQLMAAVVGLETARPVRLEGNLEEDIPRLNQDELLASLLRESPELKRARAGVERAQAVLARARAERIPDLFVRGGFGYNFEQLDALGGPVGRELFVEVGINLPIFNRNQGNIAAARAELDFAEREVRRQELVLRSRLASAFRRYSNSVRLVEQYQGHVLPRAQRAYNLYLTSFRQMAAAYPQVLIAQRTMFQLRADYLDSLIDVWQNATLLRGLLLAGGLNAPGLPPFDAPEAAQETPGVRSGEAAGIRAGEQGAGIREPEER